MTLTALLADLYRRLRYASSPAASITTRLTAFVNEAHRELLSLPGMDRLREDTLAVTAFADQARTGLPPSVARIRAITDRTNNHRLDQVPLSDLRSMDPAQAFTGGFPLRYAVVGYQAVQILPAGKSLWAVSGSASDTTQTVSVEVITSGGVSVTASATLTGTTRVAVYSGADAVDVTKFYLSATGAGAVSLYDAATDGTVLAQIPIGQTSVRYLAVEWFPVQTADVTEQVDYTRTIVDLSDGTDEPLLPPDFHYLVGLGARIKEYELTDDSRAAAARTEMLIGQQALRSFVLNNGDRIASLRQMPRRWSQLGSQFPAGS